MSPLISIITINYNNKTGLEKTIESVCAQSISDFEYLMIDGGSTDGSVELIKQHTHRIDSWVTEKDNGIYDAMNKGISKAKGEYLMFLNGGDCLSGTGILKQCIDFIKSVPGGDIYYGDMYLVNDVNNPNRNHCKFPSRLDLPFFKVDTVNHQASFIKADLFKEFGLYPQCYKLAADYWLFLKSMLNNKKYVHLGFPIVDYDFSGVSSVNNERYQKEKQLIWGNMVPMCVQELIYANEKYAHMTGYRLVTAAIWLNNKWQALRKK